MSLSKVIEIARADLGYTEDPPGSNRVKYWDAYDPMMQGQPWCVAFLWWCFREAGERMAFFGGGKTASCSMLFRWYKEQGLVVPVEQVQAGDIVLLNFHGKSDPEHCGLVTSVLGNGLYIQTIEGNTTKGDGSQDNGGMVCAKTRYPQMVVGGCRPQYQPEEPAPVDDITGHWYTDDVRWCIEKGLIKCYPDGSFRPDKPVTRAELAAVIRRLVELEHPAKIINSKGEQL